MAEKGRVTLVGGGPGDPGLLTLAGKDAIDRADVILYDRLIGRDLVASLPESALTIDVGKNKGDHPVPQDEINRLILRYALEGKNVVRLKGGDPFLFGRGAEELKQVVDAGIPFRVIPGVTSAIAAPARAGIPVTHRDWSSSLHILTGHAKEGNAPSIPYAELARLRGTLVFLMGLSATREICDGLLGGGMPPDTPAAIIENGARINQRRLSGTVGTLPRIAMEESAVSPAILVVGKVCSLADDFDWTAGLPLWGKRLLAVSSRTTGSRLASLLRENGCAVDEYAGIETEPLPHPEPFWESLPRYDWIAFTSPYGAELFFDGILNRGIDMRTLAANRFAAVGSRTARILERRGIRPDYVPDRFSGRDLGKGLARLMQAGEKALLYRAEAGSGDLPEELRGGGAAFVDFAAYRTRRNAPAPAVRENIAAAAYDAVTFTSASAAEAFAMSATGEESRALTAFCIGESTAAAARRIGMRTETSREASIESMAELILERMGKK